MQPEGLTPDSAGDPAGIPVFFRFCLDGPSRSRTLGASWKAESGALSGCEEAERDPGAGQGSDREAFCGGSASPAMGWAARDYPCPKPRMPARERPRQPAAPARMTHVRMIRKAPILMALTTGKASRVPAREKGSAQRP